MLAHLILIRISNLCYNYKYIIYIPAVSSFSFPASVDWEYLFLFFRFGCHINRIKMANFGFGESDEVQDFLAREQQQFAELNGQDAAASFGLDDAELSSGAVNSSGADFGDVNEVSIVSFWVTGLVLKWHLKMF